MSKYIKQFQSKYGLISDGIIGRNTLLKMRTVFGINNDNQLAHFLANIHHETGGFSAGIENLNYNAKRLSEIWPTRYRETINVKDKKTGKIKQIYQPNKLAYELANNPVKIANNAYANRNGNGSEQSGEGWKYRGAGSIQTTGKRNYKVLADFVNDIYVMKGAEYVADKYFWETALCYFTTGNLWGQMKYSDPESIKTIRKAVNGGTIGLASVQVKFEYYLSLIKKI